MPISQALGPIIALVLLWPLDPVTALGTCGAVALHELGRRRSAIRSASDRQPMASGGRQPAEANPGARMKISVRYDFLPKRPSVNASVVMDHFGIDFDEGSNVIADGLELPIRSGDVVFFTGPSGSGKSSLMRTAAEQLEARPEARDHDDARVPGSERRDGPDCLPAESAPTVLWIDRLALGENILVDGLELPVEEALNLLSLCGLSEAQLLLRTPGELSDGQRYRFRLAKALASRPRWVVADEFSAALDRTLAKVIAYNVRRLARRTGTGFLLATTHEDVLEDLEPDVLVRCELDGNIHVERRSAKKNRSAWRATSGSARPPEPTGRTSLGGITAATTSGSSGGQRCCGTARGRSASACSAPRC